jgi:hypothetical protein
MFWKIGIGFLVLTIIAANAKDVARYIKINTM